MKITIENKLVKMVKNEKKKMYVNMKKKINQWRSKIKEKINSKIDNDWEWSWNKNNN